MTKSTMILLFLCLQCAVIGLSIFVGWNYGLPADRYKLETFEKIIDDRFEQKWHFDQRQDIIDIETLQSVVELLQIKTNSIEAIDVANKAIDNRLARYSRVELGDDNWRKWPNFEGQYPLFLRIAQYRQKYLTSYICPPDMIDTKKEVARLLDEVEKYQPPRVIYP